MCNYSSVYDNRCINQCCVLGQDAIVAMFSSKFTITIAGHWSSKHHVGQAGCCESKDRKPHLRIKFWGNQVSGIMICPINSFNPPSSRYYGNRNVKTNLTQNCQILNCQIDLIRIGMTLCHCTYLCFKQTIVSFWFK